jgi:lipopolysaccharide assembly outer membrane protein LptD (OstA)
MKVLTIVGLALLFTGRGFCQGKQALNASPDKVTLLANNEIKTGGTLKLRGHVEISTGAITVYADEADYNPLTGDLDARGHVHINFKKATPSIKIQNGNPEDLPVMPQSKK